MLTAMAVDLIKEAKAGDQAAFEQLLRPVIEPGYRFACGMLHDPQAAEDAVQEASLLAWRKLGQLRAGTEMRPWFLGIVANQCRNVRRSRWWFVLKRDNLESPVRSGLDESGSIDLRRALARLEPGKRAVVILYFYLDLSFDEIGRVIGATPGAAKARLYRAVRELRIILDREEG